MLILESSGTVFKATRAPGPGCLGDWLPFDLAAELTCGSGYLPTPHAVVAELISRTQYWHSPRFWGPASCCSLVTELAPGHKCLS